MAATGATRKRADQVQEQRSASGSSCKRKRQALGSIDDYDKLRVVREGTFSIVIKARERRTGEKVALKRLRGEGEGGGNGAPDLDALRVEAVCQSACRGHPNIVEFKDVVRDGETGEMFLAMEFVGHSLRDEGLTAYPEDETRAMMRQLVGAAKKMHDSRVIHRDIKPEHILVGAMRDLKICDFGAATPMKPAGTPYSVCLAGTLQYTSPEQLAGNRRYGPAVDMWALGCIMGEFLTGAPLFGSVTTAEELLAELSDNLGNMFSEVFELVPELSPAGREMLTGLLAFEPEKRLTAAEALDHRWFAGKAKET